MNDVVIIRDTAGPPATVVPNGPPGHKGDPGSAGEGYASRGALAAVAAAEKDDGYLTEAGRAGKHIFSSSTLFSSTALTDLVALDTDQGVVVPPSVPSGLATDGSAGAWQRPDQWLDIEHFGVTGYDTKAAALAGADQSAKINRALQVAALLGRILSLRRFYPFAAQINLTAAPIISPNRETSGFVALSSTPAGTVLLYGADIPNLRLSGFTVWGLGATAVVGLRLVRCPAPDVDISIYDTRPFTYHFVDCDWPIVRKPRGGATNEADYQAGRRPFELVTFDGCKGALCEEGFGERVSFGYLSYADDAWRKSFFTASAATDELTIQDAIVFANANTGDSCILITHNDGALPGGLTASELRTYTQGGLVNDTLTAGGYTIYWIIKTATGFKLATSYANALAGTAIDLTTDGTTGDARTQITLSLRTSAGTVNAATDEITVSAAFYAMCSTTSPVCLHQVLTTSYPGGLTSDQTYFVIKTATANVIKLATSSANATAGTAINLTSAGAPTFVLGPKENYSNNDHISYRPLSYCRNARFIGCELGRHMSHAFDMQTPSFRVMHCYAHDNEEAATVARNAFQAKNSFGNGTEMGVFGHCHADRVKTAFGCQESQYVRFDNVSARDFIWYGILVNSAPNTSVINPTFRGGGTASDTRTPVFFRAISSSGLSVVDGTYEPSANGKTRLGYFSGSSGRFGFTGKPSFPTNLTDGTLAVWGGGLYTDSGSSNFAIDSGFGMGGGNVRHYLAATAGRMGQRSFREISTAATGGAGVAVLRDSIQVYRWSLQATTAIDAAVRVQAGRVGSSGSMIPSMAVPATAGARKDYLGAAGATASASTDKLTVPADWVSLTATGTKVRVSSATGSLPGGLSEMTDYFVIADTSTTIKLAASSADATAGTAIDLTSAGSDVFIGIESWVLTTANGLAANVNIAGSAGQSLMLEASWIPAA